jgi:hypothetical protein
MSTPQPVFLDTTAFQPADPQRYQGQPDVLGMWQDPNGHTISIHYYPVVPDLPASPDDIHLVRPALATQYAGSGCLIEADQAVVDGVRAVRAIVKLPIPNAPSGQIFSGVVIIPRDRCSVVVRTMAAEQGTTGVREAMVMAQTMAQNACFLPHPYRQDLQSALPYHAGDHRDHDSEFPDHPLSAVRRAQAWVISTALMDPQFAALPPFRPAGR